MNVTEMPSLSHLALRNATTFAAVYFVVHIRLQNSEDKKVYSTYNVLNFQALSSIALITPKVQQFGLCELSMPPKYADWMANSANCDQTASL